MSTIADLPASARLSNDPNLGIHVGESDRSGDRSSLTWKVPRADLVAFIGVVKGTVVTMAGVSVLVPLVCPFDTNQWAQRVSYRGFGADEDVDATSLWPWYSVSVDFGTNPFPTAGDSAFLSMRIQGTANQITIPNQPYHFSNGWPLQQDIGVTVGEFAISVQRHYVSDLDAAVAFLKPYVGRVNTIPIVIGAATYDAGTLLLPTFESDYQLSTLGNINQTFGYAVQYRSISWQYAMRQDGVWDALTPKPFFEADLTPIFESY